MGGTLGLHNLDGPKSLVPHQWRSTARCSRADDRRLARAQGGDPRHRRVLRDLVHFLGVKPSPAGLHTYLHLSG